MIIVTGSKGFIGRNFLKAFEDTDDVIIPVDSDIIEWMVDGFKDWHKVDLVIHQGAISSTVEKDIDKIHYYNVHLTLKLFEKCIKYGIPVKYASSASVYGNLQGVFNPLNYYAISKLQIDYWVQDNIDEFSLIQGFRYFNVYGDGEGDKGDQASPVSKFTKQVKETGKLKLFEGSDNFYRDFVCVDDIVHLVLNNRKRSGIYDLGTSNPVSFQHVAECVAKKYNGEIEYVPFPDHLKGKYQDYTRARGEWGDYIFTTVERYLK
jgi:ADP-L-glycero-D-manno-heptose 6-epimerase|tara:strand:+ start:2614 stop:3402 length:789 start_codon:yes stop_codon:yes gene_type:complete